MSRSGIRPGTSRTPSPGAGPAHDGTVSLSLDHPASDARRTAALGAAVLLPGLAAAALAAARSLVDAANAALVLVVLVVAVAATGYRLAGSLAALSAAAWFDVFLTRPYGTLAIAERADVETAVLLLVVGLGVAELAVRGRRHHDRALRRDGDLAGVREAVALMAEDADVPPHVRTELVCARLVGLLGLRSAFWLDGPVDPLEREAHLRDDAQVEVDGGLCEVERYGLPLTRPVVIDVAGASGAGGRFVLSAARGARPSAAQRLAAVALARWAVAVPRPGERTADRV